MRRLGLLGTAVGVVLGVCVGCQQQPAAQAPAVVVEDTNHHDQHRWDEHEASAYSRWEAERQKPHQEYAARPAQDQHEYWDWRHTHPD